LINRRILSVERSDSSARWNRQICESKPMQVARKTN